MSHICVIDDKEILRDSLKTILGRENHKVTTFADPIEALAKIRTDQFDVILTDLRMPKMDGLALVKNLRDSGCEALVIVMTAYGTITLAVEAMKLGAFDFIQKPFEAQTIAVVIERALTHARLRADNEALRTSLKDCLCTRALIGSSETALRLCDQIAKVASSNATVLISGESGVGKELVASYIHRQSPRCDRPMLCLNCAALSAHLLESELFGHERGAFTGADRTRKGRFEIADGGTLLLDEVSEMELSLQAKLLRVLQEGQFERVGSSTTRHADVRIIATTNRDLSQWSSQKRFREDLYYRLNVLPIVVPPLRDRYEDVAELSAYFLQRAAQRDGRKALTLSSQAMSLFESYDWPGNVRELENLCTRASTLCTGTVITAELIRPWLEQGCGTAFQPVDSCCGTGFQPGDKGGACLTHPTQDPISGQSYPREGHILADMERKVIEQTLNRYGGHRAKSAKSLGMGVRTLTMKLKKWREEEVVMNSE